MPDVDDFISYASIQQDLRGPGSGVFVILAVTAEGIMVCSECGSPLRASPPYRQVSEFKSSKFGYTLWMMFDGKTCHDAWREKFEKVATEYVENINMPKGAKFING